MPSFSGRGPLKEIIGYSMPPTGPLTLIATGYGYGYAWREYESTVCATAWVE